MSFTFDVRADLKAVQRDLNQVERSIVPAATTAALNRTAATVRTAAVGEIASAKRISPQKRVRERLKLIRAKRRTLSAHIVALLAGIKAVKLGTPRQTRRGVAVKRHRFPGAFVARMPSGHMGVFKRKGRPRLPIVEQTVPLQPEAERTIDKHINTTGAAAWVKHFTRELRWRLAKKRAR